MLICDFLSREKDESWMRILIIITDNYSYGGTARFLERLMVIQNRNGIDTALLVPRPYCNDSLMSLASQYGVEVISVINRTKENTLPLLTPIFDFLFSWRAIKSWRPDLLVVSTSDPGRMSVALFLPIPALYILHSIPESRFRFLPRCYMRMGSLLNNRIVAVSKAAAESISSTMGVPHDRISVVYNSCQLVHNKQKTGMSIVLTAAHVVQYKNPYGWLTVAQCVIKKRADVTFIWLGDGDLLTSMRDLVRNLGLEKQVLLPGVVSDLASWYEKSQVYFQPSLRESHGIAVLEAMTHGLPCVVSDIGGLPESVVDGETGFVCPSGDVAGFSDHILALLGDSELHKRMGCAGRLRAEEYFSETQQEQKIMALYDCLVKKTERR